MKFYDKEQLEKLNKHSVYGYRALPNGYGKVYCYCAKIFDDNHCKLVNLYVDTDIIAFIFQKDCKFCAVNCDIKYYKELLDSAEKNDFESSAGITLKVIAKIGYAWEVKI